MCIQNLKFIALPVPEIIAIEVLGGVCEPRSWGRGGRRWSEMVPFERALVSSYRPSIVTFSVSLRVSEILPLLYSSTPLFTTPPLVSPKFPHVPLGVSGWPFGYTKSEGVELIVRAISLQDFQSMWSWSANVTNRQTDRRTDDMQSQYRTIEHRAVKTVSPIHLRLNAARYYDKICIVCIARLASSEFQLS